MIEWVCMYGHGPDLDTLLVSEMSDRNDFSKPFSFHLWYHFHIGSRFMWSVCWKFCNENLCLVYRVFSVDIDLKTRTIKDSNWKCSVCDVHLEVNHKIDVKIYVQSMKSNHRLQNSKNIIFIPLECVTIE